MKRRPWKGHSVFSSLTQASSDGVDNAGPHGGMEPDGAGPRRMADAVLRASQRGLGGERRRSQRCSPCPRRERERRARGGDASALPGGAERNRREESSAPVVRNRRARSGRNRETSEECSSASSVRARQRTHRSPRAQRTRPQPRPARPYVCRACRRRGQDGRCRCGRPCRASRRSS